MGLVYKQHGVRLKYVQTVKAPPPTKEKEREETTVLARKLLKQAYRKKKKVLFADETCFTKKTLPRKTFASKGKNI